VETSPPVAPTQSASRRVTWLLSNPLSRVVATIEPSDRRPLVAPWSTELTATVSTYDTCSAWGGVEYKYSQI
jgi:hypothetical protein